LVRSDVGVAVGVAVGVVVGVVVDAVVSSLDIFLLLKLSTSGNFFLRRH
jgi:hypothetical protein